jgi:hypothetical protein
MRVVYVSHSKEVGGAELSLGQYGWVLPFPDFITIDVEQWQLR